MSFAREFVQVGLGQLAVAVSLRSASSELILDQL